MEMTSLDHTLLITLTVLLSIFFVLLIAMLIGVMQIIGSAKRVMVRAEEVADSVEVAAEVLRDSTSKLAFIRVITNIMKFAEKRGRK